MKKLLIAFLLLLSGTAFCQTYYTAYDPVTFAPVIRMLYDVQPPNSTATPITENWFKPRYQINCDCWYNAATTQEQNDYEVGQQASAVDCEAMVAINDLVVTARTNTQLNALYSRQQEGFKLICPNLVYPGFSGSQTEYTKQRNGTWGRNFSFKN